MEEIESLKTMKPNKFLNTLMENENGNIILEVTGPDKGTITLNYTHRPTRNEKNNKVQSITKLANNIKTSVIKNVTENIADQSQKDTLVEYVSAFNFKWPIGLGEQTSLLKKLHSIYGINYSHTVENIQEETWNEYQILLKWAGITNQQAEMINST